LALRGHYALATTALWRAPGLAAVLVGVLALAARGAVAQELSPSLALPSFDPPDIDLSGVAPFVLRADSLTQARATQCLTQAIYYEAGKEPREGQEAVAQVVLNRMRHPRFPKSVCGVVFEGAARSTGCQFTFTCDGSLGRAPDPHLWEAAERVAVDALTGHVARAVGAATHYHAVWMTPYWSPSLVESRRIGGHVFYRMPGAEGDVGALNEAYGGAEPATPSYAVAASSEVTRSARRRRAAVAPSRGVSEFSVWGLQVATITAQHGEVSVRSGS
jgi:hypothetical protein